MIEQGETVVDFPNCDVAFNPSKDYNVVMDVVSLVVSEWFFLRSHLDDWGMSWVWKCGSLELHYNNRTFKKTSEKPEDGPRNGPKRVGKPQIHRSCVPFMLLHQKWRNTTYEITDAVGWCIRLTKYFSEVCRYRFSDCGRKYGCLLYKHLLHLNKTSP